MLIFREPGSAGPLAPQNDQLMSERSILSLKPTLRLPLSRPQPLTLAETQTLLADDEAVVSFDVGDKNSYVAL
jgi:hypothetical protein